MLNNDQIIEKCKVNAELLTDAVRADLAAVQANGFEHGRAGTYPAKDLTSDDGDTDWFWDVGAEIEHLEDSLGVREGVLLRIYKAAFREGALAAKNAKRGKKS